MERKCMLQGSSHALIAPYLRSLRLLPRPFLTFSGRSRPYTQHVAASAVARDSQRAQVPHRAITDALDSVDESFFAKKASSFASLGLDAGVSRALQAAGLGKPAHVQVGVGATCNATAPPDSASVDGPCPAARLYCLSKCWA
jgi:hypothetical protein